MTYEDGHRVHDYAEHGGYYDDHAEMAPSVAPEVRTVDEASEVRLLGGLLQAPERLREIELSADDFAVAAHRLIFGAVVSLSERRAPIDFVTVAEALDARGNLDKVGGLAYLAHLAQEVVGAAMVPSCARILREKRMERQLLAASADIAELAVVRDGRDIAERQAAALDIVRRIANQAAGNCNEVTMGDAVQAAIRELEVRLERGDALGGLSTGINALDEMTDGLKPGQLIFIGGRTSMGKSVLALQMALTSAKAGKRSRYQSLEMPVTELAMRATASVGGIPLDHIIKGRMTRDEYDLFSGVACLVDGLPILLDVNTSITHHGIAASARRQQLNEGLDLLIVDHLHLLPVPRGENKAQALGEVTGAFKRLALELGIPIVLLAQLNRESAKGTPRAPTLTDFRDSGSIEQDADVCILLHRPGYYEKNADPDLTEINIAKCRNGKTGIVTARWNGACTRFENQRTSADF